MNSDRSTLTDNPTEPTNYFSAPPADSVKPRRIFSKQSLVPLLAILVALMGAGGVYLALIKPQTDLGRVRVTVAPTTIQSTPTPSLQSSTSASSTAAWKTYSNSILSLRYPPAMSISVEDVTNDIPPRTLISVIELNGGGASIILRQEPNPQQLSIDEWIALIRDDEKKSCQIDCAGFGHPVERIDVAGRRALVQQLSSTEPTVNIYVPITASVIIWASNRTDLEGYQEAKALLISILNTLVVSTPQK